MPKKEKKEIPQKKPKKEPEPTMADVMKLLTKLVAQKEGKPIEEEWEAPTKDKYPVPFEYRQIIDTILNAKFGISITPMTDQPKFSLAISVPKEYSNMTEDEWDTKKIDLRSKVVSYAEGVNGVREWAERVYRNLGPEIQAKITADRVKLTSASKIT